MMIRFAGYGIRGFAQLTLEAIEEIRASKKVLYLGQKDHYFDQLNIADSESLSSLYKNGSNDLENYNRILDKILKDAESYGDVCVLYPGHPRVGVTVLQWLEKLKVKGEIELRVIPGISSFDTMMNDLSRDPLEKGSIIIDANRLLLFKHPIDPTIDYYIYHVCSVGTAKTHFKDASQNNHIQFLKNHLLTAFSSTSEIVLIQSSEKFELGVKITRSKLGDLDRMLNQINFSTSLFIPGIRPKQVDESFLELIDPSFKANRSKKMEAVVNS